MIDQHLNFLYSPSNYAVGEGKSDEVLNAYIQKEIVMTAKVDKEFSQEEIRYGDDENQAINVYGTVKNKIFINFHGGYWIEGHRKYALSATYPYLQEGFAIATVGYKLANDGYGLENTIKDVIKATETVIEKFPQLQHIAIGGHSAGGHLALKVVASLKNPKIKDVLLFAPILKLKDLVNTETGVAIGLKDEETEKLSCHAKEVEGLKLRFLCLVGNNESPPFKEQLSNFVKELKELSYETEHHLFPNSSHFSLVTNTGTAGTEENKLVRQFASK